MIEQDEEKGKKRDQLVIFVFVIFSLSSLSLLNSIRNGLRILLICRLLFVYLIVKNLVI